MALDMWATHKTDIGVVTRCILVCECVCVALPVHMHSISSAQSESESESKSNSNSESQLMWYHSLNLLFAGFHT